MRLKAVTLRPKTQISATGTGWVANSVLDFSEKWPTEPVSRLFPILYGDNVTDEATIAELEAELLNRIYIKSAKYGVLVDISGRDLGVVNRLVHAQPSPAVYGGAVDNDERAICAALSFGTRTFDPGMGVPALPLGDITAQVTLGTSANVDGADYAVHAEVMPEARPTACFQLLTTNITPPATGVEVKYRLPETGLYRGILIYGTTIRTTISRLRLYMNDTFLDIEDTAISNLARYHHSSWLGSYLGKFAIYEKVPAAAADGGPASLPAAIEDGYGLMNYHFLDFTDDPSNWLQTKGQKFEIGLEFGDTNPVRVISIVALPL